MPLRVHLQKALHNKATIVSLISTEIHRRRLFEYVGVYVYVHKLCQTNQEIRSFKFTLLAARLVSEI
jgi:hypothetical protein